MEDLVSSHFMPVESEPQWRKTEATIRRETHFEVQRPPLAPCPLPLALRPLPFALRPLPAPFPPFHLQCLLTTSSDPDALHSCADTQSSP